MAAPSPDRLKSIEQIFYPTSIAVVGATKVPGTVPYDIFYNILRDSYQGTLFPVSPNARSICSVKTYKYILDVPDPVDLAVLVFPAAVCHLALEQCGQKGVKGAIIISAGFREVGPAGVEREQQIKKIAEKHGISFIGPNCLGLINTDPSVHLNASFARRMPAEGSIGFLSQSGALCTAVLDYAQAKNIGFSKFVSFGNKADISEIDLMYYLRDDPKTKVVLLYLEEVSDGRAFMEAARDVIKAGKPVLLIKSGRTNEGAAAAASHTGSLAGSDDVTDAAMKQAGVIRCTTIEEMFNIAIAMAYQPLPRGKSIAIITNAGGPGVLTTDAAIARGLKLGKFSEATTEIFKKSLPVTSNIKNPVDVIGDARADRYRVALSGALEDPNVDGAFVILTPQSMTDIQEIATEVAATAGRQEKPVYASFMGEMDVAAGIQILQRRSIPHYVLPESMCTAYAGALFFKQQVERSDEEPFSVDARMAQEAQTIIAAAKKRGGGFLREEEAVGVLGAFGLPVLECKVEPDRAHAIQTAERFGFPVVMKVSSDEITHKIDVQGVVLGIRNATEAGEAYDAILSSVRHARPDATVRGVLVQRMADPGVEVILGVKRDPSFGGVVMFGLGGTFVEIFKDVSFRVAPFGPRTAAELVEGIKAHPILAGARGKARRDTASVRDCVLRLSALAEACADIQELDINPLIVGEEGKGSAVADVRILV
jgi:acetyl coenzyme A synthetase (ADP forming)-like protein